MSQRLSDYRCTTHEVQLGPNQSSMSTPVNLRDVPFRFHRRRRQSAADCAVLPCLRVRHVLELLPIVDFTWEAAVEETDGKAYR